MPERSRRARVAARLCLAARLPRRSTQRRFARRGLAIGDRDQRQHASVSVGRYANVPTLYVAFLIQRLDFDI